MAGVRSNAIDYSPFTQLEVRNLAEYIDRRIGWFADAAQRRWQHTGDAGARRGRINSNELKTKPGQSGPMFDHPMIQIYEFEGIPLDRDIFLMVECWMTKI